MPHLKGFASFSKLSYRNIYFVFCFVLCFVVVVNPDTNNPLI